MKVWEGSVTAKRFLFLGGAVEDAKRKTFQSLCTTSRPSVRLRRPYLSEMFHGLSFSLKGVSNFTPRVQLQLPSSNGWTAIDA
jgi:hypothetical protein